MPPRPPTPSFRLFTDGASRQNPGPAAIGIALYTPQNALHTTFSSFLPQPTTSNIAEYLACLRALHLAHSLSIPSLDLFSDSKLIINQLAGLYSVRSSHLIPLHDAVLRAAAKFDHCTFSHIPRSHNKLADRLANQALDMRHVDRLIHHLSPEDTSWSKPARAGKAATLEPCPD